MDENNMTKKEGLSVKELESFTKKHRLEVFFTLFFLLAGIFGWIWSPSWCVVLGTIGAITGALLPGKIQDIARNLWQFVFKQDRTTQIIMAAIALVLAVFLPFVVFLLIGLHAGRSMVTAANNASFPHNP